MLNGALLIHKESGISSFGVVEALQDGLKNQLGLRKRDLPKMGHGGTLDPFATGLLTILVGQGAKLARYFLGSNKAYRGTICFGATTLSGDPTTPTHEECQTVPTSLETLQSQAVEFASLPYHQIPPMYSAKKKNGKRLYEYARAGIELERNSKLCWLNEFEIFHYSKPKAQFSIHCSSGTYIRTLAQDFAKKIGSLGFLESLERTQCGPFLSRQAWPMGQVLETTKTGTPWSDLPCWIPFDSLLDHFPQVAISVLQSEQLKQGQQNGLTELIHHTLVPSLGSSPWVSLTCQNKLVGVSRQINQIWELERIFI